MSSAKVRVSRDLSAAVAAQPGGTAASFPFGCRPPGELCELPGQSSVARVHGFGGQVTPTSVGGGEMGGSSNSWEAPLPRVLISVLCVFADSTYMLLWFSEVSCFKHMKPFKKGFAHVLSAW